MSGFPNSKIRKEQTYGHLDGCVTIISKVERFRQLVYELPSLVGLTRKRPLYADASTLRGRVSTRWGCHAIDSEDTPSLKSKCRTMEMRWMWTMLP